MDFFEFLTTTGPKECGITWYYSKGTLEAFDKALKESLEEADRKVGD